MKNKINQITIIYLLIALFTAIILYKLLLNYSSDENYPLYNFIKDIVFVFSTGIAYKYIMSRNEKTNIDILEKHNIANHEITASNERYDAVAKATSDTLWDWEIQEDKILWNKGIKDIFGYDKDQVGDGSKWWFDNIHPEDSIKMSIKLYSFIEQKTDNWQDEYRFKCADNTYKYVLDRGYILKDEKGKGIRMIGAIQDITKQKKEELRLKLLETVILQTRDSIVITEANFNEGKLPKIIYVNPAFSHMTGYEPEEIIGQSPDILKGKNTSLEDINKIISAIKNKEEAFIETLSNKKNREEYWIRFSMIPIFNLEQELTHWVSIQKDVSIEKKQEKEKEQLIRELTQNNKDLKQFSYITSHNLRAPLSNLTGLLNLIEDIPINDSELKEILEGFQKSTNLLNETVNDLNKVIIIKDNASITKEDVLLKEIFEKVRQQLSFKIDLCTPIINIDIAQLTCININKSYIESILLNLLTNSLKFKAENRQLIVNISTKQIDDTTILTFQDNGIGIDLKRNGDKVFGLYQRFHNYPDSKGLGLYLVKSQVEAMGGTINIESKVDKGTIFTITLKN
ncbi:PAS domain-containing protein [Flavobacterium sp. K5-23]|uniref:PAS domain-containing sensor histidine kinase n=1 Tax=Flavobacterium sp. K5-23 TaxID=2746225 RepID=UPI00200EC79D|nr:PAS domain-containing protein [Flavobacterium sp. K5-23]UQD57436.1 PAS domain-containing protein [Flavobacterium sp. K5-23]